MDGWLEATVLGCSALDALTLNKFVENVSGRVAAASPITSRSM